MRSSFFFLINDWIIDRIFDPVVFPSYFRFTSLSSSQCQHEKYTLLFQSFAHASVMRLSQQSMEKLYDLMVMCLKYQLLKLRSAPELHAMTLNHFDALEQIYEDPVYFYQSPLATHAYATSSLNLNSNIRKAKVFYLQHACRSNLMTILTSLNYFTKDQNTKISMFLRSGVQNNDGKFLNVENSEPVLKGPFHGINKYFCRTYIS